MMYFYFAVFSKGLPSPVSPAIAFSHNDIVLAPFEDDNYECGTSLQSSPMSTMTMMPGRVIELQMHGLEIEDEDSDEGNKGKK